MKFVGIVGSNAEQSYNRMLLEFIRKNFKTKFEEDAPVDQATDATSGASEH